MPDKMNTAECNRTENIPDVTFRGFRGEADYALILSIIMESSRADQIRETASLEDIKLWFAPSARFDPNRDISFAELENDQGHVITLGFGRVGWYTGRENTRLYTQTSYLLPEWRGVWSALIGRNENRLRELAESQAYAGQCYFQAWVTEAEVQKIAALKAAGYQAVRHFRNMLRRLDAIPEQELPEGFEVRPAQPDHYRRIWEAQREVNQELFEYFSEHWAEQNYQSWLTDPSHTPDLWQVAWDGDQVAGMVLARIDETENRELKRKRGYTEHVFIRRPWRQRGLAKALVVRSLRALRDRGIEEAELGVDSENDSGAFGFYQRLGYKTFSTDIWFRKAMGADATTGPVR